MGFSGVGPVRIGMAVTELAEAIQQPIDAPRDAEEAGCRQVDDAMHPGLGYMLANEVVARIDVDTPSPITTVSGIALGDLPARVRARYGAAFVEQPHAYGEPPDVHLTYWSPDRARAV